MRPKAQTLGVFVRLAITIFALLMVFPSYAEDAVQRWKIIEAEMAKIDRFAWEAPEFIHDNSINALKGLPGFKEQTSQTKPNVYDPETEVTYVTYFYDGLEIYGYVKDDKLAPISVKVTGKQWKLKNDISVGKSFDEVISVIGKPNSKLDDVATFQGESETIKFHLANNVILRIEFYYYTG